jgi:hypothetical protein
MVGGADGNYTQLLSRHLKASSQGCAPIKIAEFKKSRFVLHDNIIWKVQQFLTLIADVAAFIRNDGETALSMTFVGKLKSRKTNGFSNSHIEQVVDYMLCVYQYQLAREFVLGKILRGS